MLFARPEGSDDQAKHICKLASSARAQIAPRWRVLPRIGQNPKPAKRAKTVWSNAPFFTAASDQAAQFARESNPPIKAFHHSRHAHQSSHFRSMIKFFRKAHTHLSFFSPRSRILYRLSVKNQYSSLYHDNSRHFLIFVYIYKKRRRSADAERRLFYSFHKT